MKFLSLVTMMLAVAALAGSAIAATPVKPLWPAQFSATLIVQRASSPQPQFTRWMYDQVLKKDRFDSIVQFRGETWWANFIADHSTEVETALFFQQNTAICVQGAINGTLPKPNFTNLKYMGVAIVDYEVVNHWMEEDATHERTFQIFDSPSKGRIVRMDIDDRRRGEAWEIFWSELDIGAQDPALFQIPDELKAACTAVNLLPSAHDGASSRF